MFQIILQFLSLLVLGFLAIMIIAIITAWFIKKWEKKHQIKLRKKVEDKINTRYSN